MSQKKMENCQPETFPHLKHVSKIRIIGKHSLAVNPISQSQSQNSQKSTKKHQYPEINVSNTTMGVYCPELQTKPQQYVPNAKRIFVQGNLIAFLDWYDNLWFISELFPMHLNISLILYKKVKNIFLGQNQCIITTKKNPIILNWGAKRIIDISNFQPVKLSQRNSKNVNGYFSAYQTTFNKDDRFLYSLNKKVDNSNKLYHIKIQNKNQEQNAKNGKKNNKYMKNKNRSSNKNIDGQLQQIYSLVAYPLYDTHYMKNKIVGVSVGKVHCMCWDITGALYTWGSKSIALGYQQLPHQKIVSKPQLVKRLNKFVTMGFAATHYSLALCSDGSLYEWGIKKQPNQINEQLIFQPKLLKIDDTQSKVIMLKGRGDTFACLNSRHQIYIWGQRSAKYLPETVQQQYKFKNGFIYSPFCVPYLQNQNIIDFGIGEDFIALLVCNSKQAVMSEQQKLYWNDMIKRVKRKLRIGPVANAKTEANQVFNNNQKIFMNDFRNSEGQSSHTCAINSLSNDNLKSNMEKAYYQRTLKKQYFKSLKNQDIFFAGLFKQNRENALLSIEQATNPLQIQRKENMKFHPKLLSHFDSQKKKHYKNSLSQLKKSFDKKLNEKLTQIKQKKSIENIKISQLVLPDKKTEAINTGMVFSQTSRAFKNKRLPMSNSLQSILNRSRVSKADQIKKLKLQSYSQRLQKVQNRKKSLQQSFSEQISKKVQESSIQYRMYRHEKIIQNKIKQKNRNLLKHTLQAYLIKQYLVRFMISPIQIARQIKICQFAKSLHLSRIQKNLRAIFVKARISHRLRRLSRKNFSSYALLCTMFKNYVKRRREKKSRLMKKIVAQQLYKNVLREKIRLGLSKTHLNTRKLQKFRQWVVMTKIQRIKCLKVLWRGHLLSIMSLSNDSDSLAICKTQENCTFQSLYKQKVVANPMLKLETFLNKSPIFQLRYEYFQSIIFLFRKDNKIKSQKILKGMKCGTRKKQKIKFSGESGQMTAVSPGIQNSTDIMPYSLHYNQLVRPKAMQIRIPENMKKADKWVHQQIIIFQSCLKQIMQAHEKNFLKARRKYDIELAHYIRQKYDSLAEKRWKFIVQYNQIKITPYKKKRQKQLYRIFDLIGMQKILNQDCLPQKYMMLDEAVKKRDAPVAPNPYIVFGLHEFKLIFKKYYDMIYEKSKKL